ncbi:MAG: mechanosensitive ion channel domain-containing protein [Pseudomonadota bacterium]
MALGQVQDNPDELEVGVTGIEIDLNQIAADSLTWFEGLVDQLLSLSTLWQISAVMISALLGYLISRPIANRLKQAAQSRAQKDVFFRLFASIARIIWPAAIVVVLWTSMAAFSAYGLESTILRVVASLLNAWIVVRVVTSNMKQGAVASSIAFVAWTIAALHIFQLLEPVTQSLDAAAITVGNSRFSLLRILTSFVVAAFALWLGRVMGDAVQTQLRGNTKINPSMAGILGQVAKIIFMIIAVMIALSVVGVNLTALTVFSGALGVGIGFGLQTIFSNFISGIIILFERSVKVGDFIELQSGVTGQVQEISIRSTLVTTNDNVDILVPNEEFIKAQVVNWTLKETQRRLRVPFGVAYGSDKDIVRKAGLEAAAAVQWTDQGRDARAPQVWLVEFGDSSLNFELVVWLTDEAVSRPAKVQADYNWALHTALEKYDLEIPFPQRDVNFRNSEPVRVEVLKQSARDETS